MFQYFTQSFTTLEWKLTSVLLSFPTQRESFSLFEYRLLCLKKKNCILLQYADRCFNAHNRVFAVHTNFRFITRTYMCIICTQSIAIVFTCCDRSPMTFAGGVRRQCIRTTTKNICMWHTSTIKMPNETLKFPSLNVRFLWHTLHHP